MKTKTEDTKQAPAPITSAELRDHAQQLYMRYAAMTGEQTSATMDRAHLDYQLASADADRAERYDQAMAAVESAAKALTAARRVEHNARMRHADRGMSATYDSLQRAKTTTAERAAELHNRAIELSAAAAADPRYNWPLASYPDQWRATAKRTRLSNEDRINHGASMARAIETGETRRPSSADQESSTPES